MSDIYLSLTETPSVVTLSQPVIASSVAATVTVGNTVTVALDANSLSALENVTVTVGAAVSVSNFPSTQTIAGTVTVGNSLTIQSGTISIEEAFGESAFMPISGVVTANVDPANSFGNGTGSGWRGVVQQGIMDHQENEGFTVRIGPTAAPALIGYVNINSPPTGGLTTRFGSVTTASVAQLTSCVTNTSRKYLLAQNISAGTVTIGIGFSPTTTQGIQLTAGAGLTFDSFCPTGAVYWLGAVTGAAFTILEG